MEERKWKSFRNALDKLDRRKFDDMLFDIPRFYSIQLAIICRIANKILSNTDVNSAAILLQGTG